MSAREPANDNEIARGFSARHERALGFMALVDFLARDRDIRNELDRLADEHTRSLGPDGRRALERALREQKSDVGLSDAS